MNSHLISYYIGISIVLFSHLMILCKPALPKSLKKIEVSSATHAYANILAVFLIAYYFMNKEFGVFNFGV